jgi:hypothetical protein
MKRLYSFTTRVGVVSIVVTDNGRFHPEFEGDTYGSYANITLLLADLCGGHTFSFPRDIQTEDLEIPDDISEWERHF